MNDMGGLNLRSVPDGFNHTDGSADLNMFEQEIHRDQPYRAGRRHIERVLVNPLPKASLIMRKLHDYDRQTLSEAAIRVCKHFGVSTDVLYSTSRKKAVVDIKRMFIGIVSSEFGPSDIGHFLNCDHTTVIHHRKKHYKLMQTDNNYKKKFPIHLAKS